MTDDAPTTPTMPRWAKLLAAIGVLAVIGFAVLVGLAFVAMSPWQNRPPAKVDAEKAAESYVVREVERIDGTRFMRVSIAVSNGASSGSYSGGGRKDVRNILLLDTSNGTSRRLLPDNRREIEDVRFLPAEPSDPAGYATDEVLETVGAGSRKTSSPDRWYLLSLGRAQSDAIDFVVGRIDGGQAVAMTGIDGIESAWTRDPGHIALIVRDRRKLYYRIIDMATLKLSSSVPLAID